jgi:hypothetical protein
VPNANTDSPCISPADLSDARFCLYRMNVLKTNPNPDRAAMAAIASRMKRLVRSYPEGRQHQELSGYTVGTDPNNTASDSYRKNG